MGLKKLEGIWGNGVPFVSFGMITMSWKVLHWVMNYLLGIQGMRRRKTNMVLGYGERNCVRVLGRCWGCGNGMGQEGARLWDRKLNVVLGVLGVSVGLLHLVAYVRVS